MKGISKTKMVLGAAAAFAAVGAFTPSMGRAAEDEACPSEEGVDCGYQATCLEWKTTDPNDPTKAVCTKVGVSIKVYKPFA